MAAIGERIPERQSPCQQFAAQKQTEREEVIGEVANT